MKKLLASVLLLIVVGLGGFAYWKGWLGRSGPSVLPAARQADQPAQADASGTSAAGTVDAGSTAGAADGGGAGDDESGRAFDGNVAAHEWGGQMESVTGAGDESEWNLTSVLRGQGFGTGGYGKGPKEFVISFFGREPVLIDRVEVVGAQPAWPRAIEVWTSTSGPATGFSRVATATLPDAEPTTLRFDAVEARFVKVRMLRNAFDNDDAFDLSWIKVFEAQRAGYVPLLSRRRDITDPLAGTSAGAPLSRPATVACEPEPPAPLPPGRAESRKLLVVTAGWGGQNEDNFSWSALKKEASNSRAERSADLAIFDRVELRMLATDLARPYHLSKQFGYDTVVLEQACDPARPVPASFMRALAPWVAAGHKLIIQDSDKCVPGPDYGWLPYRFKTDNPGAQGAEGGELQILEDNWMVHNRKHLPGFIDTGAWMAGAELYRNELGDSNTVTEWDPRWCGQIVVRNVSGVLGFSGAYAHHGRGLIIYNGFDIDMAGTTGYDVLVAREVAQGFDPDNLPCSTRIGSFVVATEPRLRYRALAPGRSLAYPLTILSNQRYSGTVTLSAASSPAVDGLQARFEPATLAVSDLHKTLLTLSLPGQVRQQAVAVEVKGTDTNGQANSLCLQLGPPRAAELAVVSSLRPPSRTGRNLEIILDASGSMKTLLSGRKSRWDVALETLRIVLGKLPDEFNVGLRVYGHREGARSPNTCTDSELIVPIGPLDRDGILERAKALGPRGETPLVYSALQAPEDLKAFGGGTVVLITDGEESCHGDSVKAAATLRASGLDIRLNIVGFALRNSRVQKVLTAFSESTGGAFYQAGSGAALAEALLTAAVDTYPFAIHDLSGRIVAQGEAGGQPEELPPGDYKVVVKAGAKEVVAPRVSVGLGQSVTLTISMRNGQLVLQ